MMQRDVYEDIQKRYIYIYIYIYIYEMIFHVLIPKCMKGAKWHNTGMLMNMQANALKM